MNTNYKLKIPTNKAALIELLSYLERSSSRIGTTGEALFIKREVETIIKLLFNKVNSLTNPRSITFNIFQLRALEYCYYWYSDSYEITEFPQMVQLLSSIKSKYNPSNYTIAAQDNVSIMEH